MSEERRVIGHFRGFNDVFKKDYVFVDVICIYEDGKIVVVDDPYTEFPSDGNFYLNKNIGNPPTKDSYGVWVIRKNQIDRDITKRHMAEYSAVRYEKAVLPLEILPLDLDSTNVQGIRDSLMAGIDFRFVPFGNVIWKLRTGEFIGPLPIQVEGSSNIKVVSVDSVNLEKPIGLWASIPQSEMSNIKLRDISRLFMNKTEPGKPAKTIDLAGPEDGFRSVVRFAWKKIEGEKLLSKKQYTQLVEQLASQAGLPEEIQSRAESVIRLLKQSVEAGEKLDDLAEFVKSHAIFRNELEDIKKKAEQDAKEALLKSKSDLNDQIGRLQTQEHDVKARLKKLDKDITEKGKELLNVPEKVMKAFKEKIEKAKLDPIALLSEVAILEPFLAKPKIESSATAQRENTLGHIALPNPLPEGTVVESIPPLDRLIDNLKLLGINVRQSESLGIEFFASLRSTRTVSLVGTGANMIAGLMANSMAAGNSFKISMPLGIVGSAQLSEEMAAISQKCDLSKACVVVIDGANRSAIELYGDWIRDNSVAKLFGDEGTTFKPIFILTTIKGDTVLDLGEFYSDLGGVFDCDVLTMKVSKTQDRFKYSSESLETLMSAGVDIDLKLLPEEVEELKKRFCRTSMLFELNIQSAFRALNALKGSRDEKFVVQALLFGWLIPRALASGVSVSEMKEGLESELDNVEAIDSRLASLLKVRG